MNEGDNTEPRSLFDRLKQTLQRRRRARSMACAREAGILAATERLVDEIDPRLRAVSGYRKKLRQPVERSLAYTTEIVRMIPGPVQADRRTWSGDPLIRAFFSGPEDLRRLFSRSEEVRGFFDRRPRRADHCYAMLSMIYREKAVLGTELDGEILRRDVKQTSVSFEDLRVVKPGASEFELRQDLQERAFDVMAAYALEQITDLKLAQDGLREQRHLLEMRLKLAKLKTSDLKGLLENKTDQVAELQEQLDRAGEQLRQSTDRLNDLDDYIDIISRVLNQPQDHLHARQFPVSLNKLNIKLDKHSANKGEELQLTEITLGDELRRVMTIVTFPRDELLPEKDPLKDAKRVLQ